MGLTRVCPPPHASHRLRWDFVLCPGAAAGPYFWLGEAQDQPRSQGCAGPTGLQAAVCRWLPGLGCVSCLLPIPNPTEWQPGVLPSTLLPRLLPGTVTLGVCRSWMWPHLEDHQLYLHDVQGHSVAIFILYLFPHWTGNSLGLR